MANYDDVVEKNKRYLTQAQINALAEASKQYNIQNAGNRAGALASAREQFDTGYRGLQNMGLAGATPMQPTSGEVPRLVQDIRTPFDDYNRRLNDVEHRRLDALGGQFAQQTQAARAAAQQAERARQETLQQQYQRAQAAARAINVKSLPSAPKLNPRDLVRESVKEFPEQQKKTLPAVDTKSTLAKAGMAVQQTVANAQAIAAASLLGISAPANRAVSNYERAVSPITNKLTGKEHTIDEARGVQESSKAVRSVVDSIRKGSNEADRKALDDAQKQVNYIDSLYKKMAKGENLTDKEIQVMSQERAAVQRRDLAKEKLENPEKYASRVVLSDPSQRGTAAWVKATRVMAPELADNVLESMGIRKPTMTDEQFTTDMQKVKEVRRSLNVIDSLRQEQENKKKTGTTGAIDYDQQFIDEELETLKKLGYTEEKARKLVKGVSNERQIRSEYEYYQKALQTEIENDGLKPSKPVNQSETDTTYRLANNLPSMNLVAKSDYEALATAPAGPAEYMTDEQRNTYNALYETEGIEAANKYVTDISPILNLQRAEKDRAYRQEMVNKGTGSAIWQNLLSVGTNLIGNVPAMMEKLAISGYNAIANPDVPVYIDQNSGLSQLSNRTNYIREATSEKILTAHPNTWGKVANFLYQSGMSMADSAAAMAVAGVLGNTHAVDALFFSSAGNEAYRDARERGATQDQAMGFAVLSGAAEAIFEHVSVETFADQFIRQNAKARRSALAKLLIQSGTEASEEVATEIANKLSDAWVMGDKSEYDLKVKELMSQDKTLTKEQAEKKAFMDALKDVGMAGLGGLVSGLGFGLTGAIATKKSETKTGKAVKENGKLDRLTRAAKLFGGDVAQQAAEVEAGKQSDAQVGSLLHELQLAQNEALGIDSESNEQITEAQAEELAKKGEALGVIMEGEQITAADAQKVIDTLGADKLAKMGYDASSAESFAKSYNEALESKSIKPISEVDKAEREFAQGKAVKELREESFERVYRNPKQGLAYQYEGKTVTPMPGNMTAVEFAEHERANFKARTTAKMDGVTLELSGMEARQGLTDEQIFAEAKKTLTKQAARKLDAYMKIFKALSLPMVIRDVVTGTSGYVHDGKLYVTLSGRQSILRVVAHELTHQMKDLPGYASLRNRLIAEVGGQAEFDKLIEEKAQKYGLDLDTEEGREEADDEVCAELCERMLANEEALEKFAEKDTEAAKTLRDRLLKILNAIKQALKSVKNRDFGDSKSALVKEQETIEEWYKNLSEAIKNANEKKEQKTEAKQSEAVDLFMDEETARNQTLKQAAEESGKKKTYVRGYSAKEVESVISSGLLGDKSNYEGDDYENARGMIAQLIPDIVAAFKGEADLIDVNEKVKAAVGVMYDNYIEDNGDMATLRSKIPTVIGVDNTAKTDLTDENLFGMSAKLSKALGRKVTLVSKTNAQFKNAEQLADVWEDVRDTFGLSEAQDFSVDLPKLLEFIQKQADTRKTAKDVFGSSLQDEIDATAGEIISAVQDMYEAKTGERFSLDIDEYQERITKNTIEAIRKIGKKSINDFDSDDIKASAPFAVQYNKTFPAKEKSPFFRAWFGEWRANSTDQIGVADMPEYVPTNESRKKNRGTFKNADTGWDIDVSREGETNAISHSNEGRKSEYGLAGIKQLVEKAILFESEVHEHHQNNAKNDMIAFDHKLYAMGQDASGIALYRITVEEYFQDYKHPDKKRFHNLKYIEKVADFPGRRTSGGNRSGGSTNWSSSTTRYTVSDLYSLVNKYDKEFTPGRKVNPAFMNEDGTPKVFYHGTYESFDAFDRTKGRSNMDIQGMFFSPYEIEAEGYGPNVGQYYLSIHNPASEALGYKALNMFKGQNNAGVKAREYLESKGYDGVIGYDEVIAFQPTQIKSATDNIGTFNKYDERYRYSVDTDAIRQAFTVIDTEGIEDGLEALKGVKHVGMFALKDISRMLDASAGKNKDLRNTLHAIFEKPHSEATGKYARGVERMQNRVMDIAKRAGVVDAKGKHFDSKKSAAIQNIGEGFSNTYTDLRLKVKDADHVTVKAYEPGTENLVVSEKDYTLKELRKAYGTNAADYVWSQVFDKTQKAQESGKQAGWVEEMVNTRPYTLADLQAAFPNEWQQLKRAADEFRDMYDEYIRDQNNMLATIYPIESEFDSEDRVQKAIDKKQERLEQHKTAVNVQLDNLQKRLESKEQEMAGKKRTDTKAFRDLVEQANRIGDQIASVKSEIAEYEANVKEELVKLAALKAEYQNARQRGELDSLSRMHRLQYRSDYFHHFTEMASGIQNLRAIFTNNTDISPKIVGRSENTKAKSKWTGYFQERMGGDYTADAINGMLKYGQLAEYKLAFDPLTAYLRDVNKQIRNLDDNTNRDGLIRYIDQWADAIAGKSHKLDRNISDLGMAPRKAMQILNWINSRVIQNTLLFNARSALIQISNITNAKGIVKNNIDWLNGLRSWALAAKGDQAMANIMAQSNFLASRYMDNLQLTDSKLKSAKAFGGWMLGALDEISAKATWWAAYQQYTRNPNAAKNQYRAYDNAIDYADDVTRRTHAGRGVGELAPAMTSRVINFVAPFQVEVNNTFQLLKDNVKQGNYLGILSTGLSVFLFNALFEGIVGSSPLQFDFIRAVLDIVLGFAQDDPKDDKDDYGLLQAWQRLSGEAFGSLPYAGQLASIIGEDTAKKLFGTDNDATRYGNTQIGVNAVINAGKGVKDIATGLVEGRKVNWVDDLDDLLNLTLPFGAKQLTRTIEGVRTVAKGYEGKYDKEGKEQVHFTTDGDILEAIHAALFGKWSLTEASEYFGEKRLLPQLFGEYNGPKSSIGKAVDAKEYKAALEAGITGKEYFTLKSDLSKYSTQPGKRAEMMQQQLTPEQKAKLDALMFGSKDAEMKAEGAVVYQKSGDEWKVKADYTNQDLFDLSQAGDKAYTGTLEAMEKTGLPQDQAALAASMWDRAKEADDRKAEFRSMLRDNANLTVEQKEALDLQYCGNKYPADYSDPELYDLSVTNRATYEKAKQAKAKGVPVSTFTGLSDKKAAHEGDGQAAYMRGEIMKTNLTAKQKELMDDLLVSDKGANPDYSSQAWFEVSMLGKTQYDKAKTGEKVGVKPEVYLAAYKKYKEVNRKDKDGKYVNSKKEAKRLLKEYLDKQRISAPVYDYIWTAVFGYKSR